jgi:hypothetical protein
MSLAHEDLAAYGEELAESGARSLASLSKGAQAIANEAAGYVRSSVEAGGAFVEELFSAASPEEALDIQARYVRRSYEAFVVEAGRIGELYADLAGGAYRPFESLVVAAD